MEMSVLIGIALSLAHLVNTEFLAKEVLRTNALRKDIDKEQNSPVLPELWTSLPDANTNIPIIVRTNLKINNTNNLGGVGRSSSLNAMIRDAETVYKKRTLNLIVGRKLLSFLDKMPSNDIYTTPKTINVPTEIYTNQPLRINRLPNYTGANTGFFNSLTHRRMKGNKHFRDAQNDTISINSVNNNVNSYQVTKNPIIDDIKDKGVTQSNIHTNPSKKRLLKSMSIMYGLRSSEDYTTHNTREAPVRYSTTSSIMYSNGRLRIINKNQHPHVNITILDKHTNPDGHMDIDDRKPIDTSNTFVPRTEQISKGPARKLTTSSRTSSSKTRFFTLITFNVPCLHTYTCKLTKVCVVRF